MRPHGNGDEEKLSDCVVGAEEGGTVAEDVDAGVADRKGEEKEREVTGMVTFDVEGRSSGVELAAIVAVGGYRRWSAKDHFLERARMAGARRGIELVLFCR